MSIGSRPGPRRDDFKRIVRDQLGDRLLPAQHHLVDEARKHFRSELSGRGGSVVFGTGPLRGMGNGVPYFFFWLRLAPYFERPCLRFAAPDVSSVPRMMWSGRRADL